MLKNYNSEFEFDGDENDECKNIPLITYMNSIIYSHNYISSFGTIIMNNGVIIRIRKFYEYFREMWNEYKLTEASGTEDELLILLKEKTNGGIVTNGEIDIYLPNVSAMISDYSINNRKKNRIKDKNEGEDEDTIVDEF